MPAILEALRGRMIQREANAIDTVVAGARAAVRGESFDVGSLEKALADTGKTMADFEEIVDQARQRRAWLADFDKLASVTSKVKKLEAAAAAEREKFEAAHAAFIERSNAIDSELAIYRTAKEKGEVARSGLLDPRAVPGTVGEKYREALAESDAAASAVERARREIREQSERVKSEEGWITQLTGEETQDIKPVRLLKGDHPAEAESFRLQDHRLALARAQRRKEAAEAELVEAEKAAAKARKALDAIIPEVLKA